MDTSRLRKTFKYPSDGNDSDISSHDEMDEQEQETLISSLRSKEATSNAQYTLIFSVLPLVGIPVFLYYLVILMFSTPQLSGRIRFLPLWCLLSVTSLLSTAYTMWFVEVSASDSASGLIKTAKSLGQKLQKQRKAFHVDNDKSPIQSYLPVLNLGICGLLCLAAWANKGRGSEGVPDGFWMFLLLPPVMLGMIFVARQSMAEVQGGIGRLEGMKYDYKGA